MNARKIKFTDNGKKDFFLLNGYRLENECVLLLNCLFNKFPRAYAKFMKREIVKLDFDKISWSELSDFKFTENMVYVIEANQLNRNFYSIIRHMPNSHQLKKLNSRLIINCRNPFALEYLKTKMTYLTS